MAEENQDGQEKTEEPSQRKINKAKEDGKVLTSKEMFVFTSIAAALLFMYALSFFGKSLLFEWGDLFVLSGPEGLDDMLLKKPLQALFYIIKFILLIGLPMIAVVLATQFAVGGINFAPKAAGFKGNKLNPIHVTYRRQLSLQCVVSALVDLHTICTVGGRMVLRKCNSDHEHGVSRHHGDCTFLLRTFCPNWIPLLSRAQNLIVACTF